MNIDTITVLQVLKWNNKAIVTVTITMLVAIFQFPAVAAFLSLCLSNTKLINAQ